MRRLLNYLALSVGLLVVLGIGYIGYLRYRNYANCPTIERPTPLAFPQYPQITRAVSEVIKPDANGEWRQHVFLTADTPETVMTFYLTTLRAQGWREIRRYRDDRGYQIIEFRETRFSPTYFLDLYTNGTQSGTTVEVVSGSDKTLCIRY